MDMKYRVVVVGGGPSGACAAEEFAKDKNIETVLLEVRGGPGVTALYI
jgi:geranylgeranyl diphosphate/geranylgeranyl-bacteriochlorophyllide a reductase